MIDSRPVLEQYNELLGILGWFTQHKMNMDESIQVSCIIDKLPSSWKDCKHTLKHLNEELTLIELCSHVPIEESFRMQDSDKPKDNKVFSPSVVNMVEHNNSSGYNDNKGKHKPHDTRANPNKKTNLTCWKCGKLRHLKKDCKASNIGNRANISSTKGSKDGSANPLKVRILVHDYESLNDGSILHMGNESTALVDGRGYVDRRAAVRLPDPKLKTLGERGCKPLSYKRIFKRKLKVDGTVKKIKMDVKIAFLNGELEKEAGLTKEFLSSTFSMKDMGKADVILSIRINHESNGVAISQSHYIEKFLKKFNYSDCTPVSTPLDTCEKLMPNRAAGKEAEWLKNLLLKIPLWVQTYGTHIYQL
nr:zinc finger, CCHC-type [Tanacetum cinerariifolium]